MKVLIVEDEPGVMAFLKKGLAAEKFTVDAVNTAEKGLDLIKKTKYDLILLDIMLPGHDGIWLASTLREMQKTTPIIMLTARGDLDTKIEALDMGADDFLTKPFDFEELLARIRALMRRPRQIRSNILTVGNLRLDVRTREVSRQGKYIDLGRKEFALLEYLMANPGLPVKRAALVEHVWGYGIDPLTNTVDVHIRYLRQKIDEPFRKKMIKTVHGIGYKITAS